MLTAVATADKDPYDGIILLLIIVLNNLPIGFKEKVHNLSENLQCSSTTLLFEADFAILDLILAWKIVDF